jgi:hypothetical protein
MSHRRLNLRAILATARDGLGDRGVGEYETIPLDQRADSNLYRHGEHGPAGATVWNSPLSPHASTSAGSASLA